jgi:fructose-bisphosphate aldolase class I
MSKFIAAMDHSGGSTGGVLERYGQEYTEENKMDLVHAMRLRMINSPNFTSNNIWAAILYKDSVDRGAVDILGDKGIEAILKVDSGCHMNGLLKEFDLDSMIDYALEKGCTGTKMRSIQLATVIFAAGLMPIVEPEVPIDSDEKIMLEEFLARELMTHLDKFDGKCILKLTLPERPNLYDALTEHPKVHKVVGLSGGYDTREACNKLGLQHNMTASFSRALSEGLFYNMSDDAFNAQLSANIHAITKASE